VIRSADEAREGLYQQIPHPVRWEESIRCLAQQGVTTFVEVGPGTVLSGLVRKTLPQATVCNFGEPGDWNKLAATLGL